MSDYKNKYLKYKKSILIVKKADQVILELKM